MFIASTMSDMRNFSHRIHILCERRKRVPTGIMANPIIVRMKLKRVGRETWANLWSLTLLRKLGG